MAKESRLDRVIGYSGVLLVLFLIAGTVYGKITVRPPDGVDTYAEYRTSMKAPTRACLVQTHGEEFLVALGPWPWDMGSSGPPAYVFDRCGRMVEWTEDTGDHSVLGKPWRDWKSTPVPLESLEAWFAEAPCPTQ